MALDKWGLDLLILEDGRHPGWNPVDLFVFEDNSIPDGWKFTTVNDFYSWALALWGYGNIIRDPTRHYKLELGEESACMDFFVEVKARYDGGQE